VKFAAVILTKNESMHIARCLESIAFACDEIVVVDSGSTDDTVEICQRHGARVIAHPWVNYASQFNFGLSCLAGDAAWVVRIDADEYLLPGWDATAARLIAERDGLDGIAVRRTMCFMGKAIRWGGVASWQLRIFRRGHGECEARWMDEHIVVRRDVATAPIRLVDDNLNNLEWWTQKHLGYANREAIDILLDSAAGRGEAADEKGTRVAEANMKRIIKERIYNRLPGGLRAALYFFLRYVVLLGFLDGRRGFLFHFFQGWWYRTLVDCRVREIRDRMVAESLDLPSAIFRETGLDLSKVPPHD
jgi:glycosyltransferase involved in cell wall biosynthesis